MKSRCSWLSPYGKHRPETWKVVPPSHNRTVSPGFVINIRQRMPSAFQVTLKGVAASLARCSLLSDVTPAPGNPSPSYPHSCEAILRTQAAFLASSSGVASLICGIDIPVLVRTPSSVGRTDERGTGDWSAKFPWLAKVTSTVDALLIAHSGLPRFPDSANRRFRLPGSSFDQEGT